MPASSPPAGTSTAPPLANASSVFDRENTHAVPFPARSDGAPTSAVLPSAESATRLPKWFSPFASSPATSSAPSGAQLDPERLNTHAPPLKPLSRGEPISAVFPSAERATLAPNPHSPSVRGSVTSATGLHSPP